MRKILSLMLAAMMIFALAACTAPAPEATPAPSPDSTPEAEGKFTAGTYTGSANGFGGLLTAEVTLSENRIESVAITEHSETAGIGSNAIEALPGRIVAAQSIAVDGVSGATYTSGAIFKAVTAALLEAGVDAAALVPVPAEEGEAGETVLDCDVVVIGAGGAGLAAAITAHDAGKSVIIVEKTAMAGGNSVRSTGGMNAAATPSRRPFRSPKARGGKPSKPRKAIPRSRNLPPPSGPNMTITSPAAPRAISIPSSSLFWTP